MSGLNVYLRCERDHATTVPLGERMTSVGQPCSRCGRPLMAEPERERGPSRGPPRRF
ncbi:MAG: hypothetical protein HYT80_11340 [Euryarchaeota archaeon]|nr:hypothetical protein [Euryarchaeota archaeon]